MADRRRARRRESDEGSLDGHGAERYGHVLGSNGCRRKKREKDGEVREDVNYMYGHRVQFTTLKLGASA